MTAVFRILMVGVILSACACAIAPAALAQENTTAPDAPAVEQDDDAGNETQVDQEIADQLGNLLIHEYSYSDGEMVIEATWTGDTPESVTLVEMIELDSEGTADISFQTTRLIPDERTEITVSAKERSGGTAAVLVNTPSSIDRGEALVLQSGDPTNWPEIGLDSAVVATTISAAGAAALTFVFVLRRKHDQENGITRQA